ncbi:hypothetical protein HGO38_11510 [Rhizobium sp. CG5]|uniref:hypothetical protein n=1 Tax=Rhizobium sp. CG5 TaxID=2726076 RepID=UPI0020338B40|nr:hypothetical protein [Rhizobium sp. CG5]MCM2474099.1 hypothetical protein [Rhizobium sp. CG5]
MANLQRPVKGMLHLITAQSVIAMRRQRPKIRLRVIMLTAVNPNGAPDLTPDTRKDAKRSEIVDKKGLDATQAFKHPVTAQGRFVCLRRK